MRNSAPRIFEATDHDSYIRLSARHHRPSSDDFILTVGRGGHYEGQYRSVLMDRAQAVRLHAALGRWLEEGWPDVTKDATGDERRAAAHARAVAQEAARREAAEAELAQHCEPTGSLTEPPPPADGTCRGGGHRLVCEVKGCGVPLRTVPNSRGEGWMHVDTDGNTDVASPPVLTYTRTVDSDSLLPTTEKIIVDFAHPDAWDLLAKVDVARYSAMSAAYQMGHLRFWHAHRAAPCPAGSGHAVTTAPECHGHPMRLVPAGWRCRAKDVTFSYEDSEGGRKA